jgi:hypothetical protein
MAELIRFRPVLGIVASLLIAAASGCESTTASHNLPTPNFNAPPVMAQAPTRAVAPPASRVAPPVQRAQANVPREWIPTGRPNNWRWIVIHHSASPVGSVAAFDRAHRQNGWDECGYHFVIGNGSNTADGQVEVGPRWPKQKWGAHAKTADNRYNEFGIGICLVGNFEVTRPSARQQQQLARLVAYLMKTYNIPPERVIGHRDTKATECPGRNMNIALVRRNATQALADAGDVIPRDAITAVGPGTELLHESE